MPSLSLRALAKRGRQLTLTAIVALAAGAAVPQNADAATRSFTFDFSAFPAGDTNQQQVCVDGLCMSVNDPFEPDNTIFVSNTGTGQFAGPLRGQVQVIPGTEVRITPESPTATFTIDSYIAALTFNVAGVNIPIFADIVGQSPFLGFYTTVGAVTPLDATDFGGDANSQFRQIGYLSGTVLTGPVSITGTLTDAAAVPVPAALPLMASMLMLGAAIIRRRARA